MLVTGMIHFDTGRLLDGLSARSTVALTEWLAGKPKRWLAGMASPPSGGASRVAVPDGTTCHIVLPAEDRQRVDETIARKTPPAPHRPPMCSHDSDAMTGCGTCTRPPNADQAEPAFRCAHRHYHERASRSGRRVRLAVPWRLGPSGRW